MNQITIGNFIAKKRREKNMTQVQLAEKLNVSSKTISKWETGKCMPDYSVIELLCQELGISMAELMDGEEEAEKIISTYNNAQIIDLLKRTQALEQQRTLLFGLILILMGMVLLILHYNVGGSAVKDFLSGVLLGISIAEMLAGIFVAARGFAVRL